MLKSLGIKSLKLMTNNPDKIEQLEEFGIEISERVPIVIKPGEFNRRYYEIKKEKMRHLF